MYCGNCGKQIPDSVKFCPECGSSLSVNGQRLGDNLNKQADQPAKKKKGSGWIIAILVIVVLAVIAVGGIYCYQNDLLPFGSNTHSTAVDNGTWDEELSWMLDDEGTLTISGTGRMADWDARGDYKAPWRIEQDSIKSVVIEPGMTSIGEYAFFYCGSLTSVDIPDGVTRIGEHAFEYCDSLTDVVIPDSVTNIGANAFNCCDNLTSVDIPAGVMIIQESAFEECDSLTNVVIPDGVTDIGHGAFSLCESLESVDISESVMNIGYNAFYECSSLESVTIRNPECSIYNENDTIDDGATIYGYTNSTAQQYAEKYGREFVALD